MLLRNVRSQIHKVVRGPRVQRAPNLQTRLEQKLTHANGRLEQKPTAQRVWHRAPAERPVSSLLRSVSEYAPHEVERGPQVLNAPNLQTRPALPRAPANGRLEQKLTTRRAWRRAPVGRSTTTTTPTAAEIRGAAKGPRLVGRSASKRPRPPSQQPAAPPSRRPRPTIEGRQTTTPLPGPLRSVPAALERTSPARRPAGLARGEAQPKGKRARVEYATNAERRAEKAGRRADALISELPEAYTSMMADAAQVPSVDRRMAIYRRRIVASGGPEGDVLHKALRSWRLLVETARARGLPDDGLPAGEAIVADIVSAERERAASAARGSRGGITVGKTILEGFVALSTVAGLPIQASGPNVEAAAEPDQVTAVAAALVPTRQAGSLPLKFQVQLETLAKAPDWSVARVAARCFLASCFVHHIRLNDALNGVLILDEKSPSLVIRGRAVLKARRPAKMVELYAPAEGWTGPFAWVEEHVEELGAREHAFPDFEGSVPSKATALRAGVVPPTKARKALADLMGLAPLCMTAAEYASLGITTHSPHGTGADMVRFMGAHSMPWGEEDARALGHWLRDKNAPQHQRDLSLPPSQQSQAMAPGAPAARGGMTRLYSSGSNRKGEREEQLKVRERFVAAVQAAVARHVESGAPWPAGTDDWYLLIPPGV